MKVENKQATELKRKAFELYSYLRSIGVSHKAAMTAILDALITALQEPEEEGDTQ